MIVSLLLLWMMPFTYAMEKGGLSVERVKRAEISQIIAENSMTDSESGVEKKTKKVLDVKRAQTASEVPATTEPKDREEAKVVKKRSKEKPHFGRYEKVQIEELGDIVVPVKLDTGAYTSSLNAVNIEHFVKDHESWVRFNPVVDDEPLELIELPIVKVSKIKQRAEEEDEEEPSFASRPVVKMNVCLGGMLKEIDVNLTNRNNFRYPMLIGAKALRQFRVVVDASLRNTEDPQCE